MTSFTDIFNNASDDGFAPSDDLPAGKYKRLRIVSANTGSTKAGKPKFGFLLKDVEEGSPTNGDVVWMNQVLSAGNDKAESIFKRVMFTQLGITGPQLDADADRAVEQTVGQEWSAEIKVNGDFTNVYLGKLQNAPASGSGSSPAPTPAPVQEEVAVEPDVTPAPATPSDPEPEADSGKDVWDI